MSFGLMSFSSPNNLASAKTLIGGFDVNGSSFAFINFFKAMGNQGSSSGPFQSQINSDGYPATALTNGYELAVSTTGEPFMASTVTWVLKWTGKIFGNLSNGGAGFVITSDPGGFATINGTSINFSGTMNGTTNQVEFTNNSTASQFDWKFFSGAGNDGTGSNLRLYRKTDETAFNAGSIFTPEFLSLMKVLNPKILRTLDWGHTNSSNSANFAYRTPITALSYSGRFWTQGSTSLWGGTATGTDTYACSNPTASGTGAYVAGETVQVFFTNANTITTPTLQLGTRGAVTIATGYGAALSAGSIQANSTCTLVYDLWLNVWLLNAGQTSFNAVGDLLTGVPIEVQVALCNTLNINLWYNIPFLYTDASVTAVAAYIRSNLKIDLIAYFEFTNEHWNFPLATQATLCQLRGAYLGFPNNNGRQENGYYGLRVRQIMALITTAWSPRAISTLRRVTASQAQSGAPSAIQTYQFNGADLSTALGYTNYNSVIGVNYNVGSPTFSRPIDFCDVISYASYYAGPVLSSGSYAGFNALDISSMTNAADTNNLSYVDNQFRQGVSNAVTASLPSGISGNIITVGTNNLVGGNNDVVVCTVAAGGSFPSGISASTVYYVVNQTATTIQLSATRGGPPLTISGGTTTLTVGSLGGETLLWFNTFVYSAWEPIAASYDGARPAGYSNVTVECYEGALEAIAPTTAQCTAMGISTSYSASIATLIVNYKNNNLSFVLVQDQFKQFMLSAHSVTPAWFALQGPSQWSLMPGSTFSTPFQTYYGVAAYH